MRLLIASAIILAGLAASHADEVRDPCAQSDPGTRTAVDDMTGAKYCMGYRPLSTGEAIVVWSLPDAGIASRLRWATPEEIVGKREE
jgi:hypothetical protein